jgi:Tol biopolymer transport system component
MSRTFLIGYVPQYRVLLRDRQAGTTEVVASFLGPGPDERFDAGSGSVAISADGRFVAFDSASGDLVSNDTNGVVDVFVYDRTTKAIERASVGTGGAQGNEGSFAASITPNGRYVAFWSDASNLVTADTNNIHDVFVRDRQTGVTQRVSVDSEERQVIGPGSAFGRTAPAISSGARFVAFYSDAANLVPGDADGLNDVFVRDRVAGTTERINSGPGGSAVCGGRDCAVSLNAADGRYVAFVTSAPLVRGDNNGEPDVYVHDRWMDRVEIASVRNNGRQLPAGVQPSLSADGRFVAFHGYGPEWFANERVYLHELGGTDIWDYRVVGGRDFGAQPVGTTGTSRIYSVQNRGSVVLTIERLELRGTDAANFRLSSQCGATLAVGASCNVRVTFVPRSVGMKSAKLAAVFALREGTGAFTKTLLGTGT